MAHQIRINPNALRDAAYKQRELGEMIQDTRVMLRNQAVRLDIAWEGSAGSRAVNALMKGAESAGQIGEAISENARKLTSIAAVFENADTTSSGGNAPHLNRDILNAVVKLAGSSGFAPSLNIDTGVEISVEPHELRNVASRCDDTADKLWDMSRHLQSIVNTLNADWEGRAYERFAQDTQIVSEALRRCAESLRATAERIVYAAYRYEEMDAALS